MTRRRTTFGELIVEPVVGVLPPVLRRGRKPSPVPDRLLRIAFGECADVNRPIYAVRRQVELLKERLDFQGRFIIRDTGRPGWSRVWRVS